MNRSMHNNFIFARFRSFLAVLLTSALCAPAARADDAVAVEPPVPPSPAASAGGGSPYPAATPQAVVDVTARIFPAVVRLDVAQEVYAEGKRTLQRGIGSGVIIDEQGRIL